MTQPDQKCEYCKRWTQVVGCPCTCNVKCCEAGSCRYGCSFCQTAKPEPDEMDNCICSEYDRKGKSTCGFDCPVHKKAQPEAESWAAKFDKKFPELEGANAWHYTNLKIRTSGHDIVRQADNLKNLKPFIRYLLDKERERVMNRMKTEHDKYCNSPVDWYKSAEVKLNSPPL